MKSYRDAHGNFVPGSHLIEDLLADPKKRENLFAVLDALDLQIVPTARLDSPRWDWITKKGCVAK